MSRFCSAAARSRQVSSRRRRYSFAFSSITSCPGCTFSRESIRMLTACSSGLIRRSITRASAAAVIVPSLNCVTAVS